MGDQNIFLRELANGTLFLLQLFIWLSLFAFIRRRMRENNCHYRPEDKALNFALVVSIYFLGAFISRAVPYFMFLSDYMGRRLDIGSSGLMNIIGIAIGVVGGMLTIRLLLPERYAAWIATAAGIIALLTPVVVHAAFWYFFK
jgi:hypothetical protein